MAINSATEVHEAAVSSETAISCLALLSTQIGVDLDTEKVRARQQVGSATLAISKLIDLADDFGFSAQYVHRDWAWLQLVVATQPVVLVLKNGNAIVAVGLGHTGAAEIVVSDPLHRGGALIILPRDSIERAWDGDAVVIIPKPRTIERLDTFDPEVLINPPPTRARKAQKFWKLFAIILLCLGSVAVVTALITIPITEKSVVHRTTSPAPAVALPPAPAITTRTGPQQAADQASVGRAPIDAHVSTTLGSIAGGAIPQDTPPRPSDLELPGLATIASATAPIAEAPVEANLPNSAAGPGNAPDKDAPSQTLSAATKPMPGPAPVDQDSARPGEPKLSAADIASALARGDEQLRLGDVTSARLFYEHAADAGEATAALKLAETFDPIFLEHANLRGASGDMVKAFFWYSRARDLGSDEANKLLKGLDADQGIDH